MQRIFYILCLFIILVIGSCLNDNEISGNKNSGIFQKMNNKLMGIDFINEVSYTEEYNTYTYRNFYNGGGTGLGDINNDGLLDVYFTGNIVDNKLYLNNGDFTFEDITEKAGLACPDVWSTGVSMIDINGDGWLDIYVCKSGDPDTENRHNELFINNGDLTFSEKAEEYGIADMGLSTHAAFFDYDRDGDLDCYLLNNSFQSVTGYKIKKGLREIRDPKGGNKLYRNEGRYFTDVSAEAGIYGSLIGFGLGVTVGDVNLDGWLDIYVSNDFFEKDYLYINNTDGTFTESLEQYIRETSLGSMGADMADINNDGYPEIFVTEMTPEPEGRLKTKAMFESWDKYQFNLDLGYYHQFARNVLQLNNKNGSFSEIGRLAGVWATDWSWGALIFDMDNDGWKDLFVANGIYKDLLDQDYINFYSDPAIIRGMIRNEEQAIIKMIEAIPSERVPNYAFHNQKNLHFINKAQEWGLGEASFSNGAAYGDLDNDGDLDIVVNNVNMPPFIYRNNITDQADANYLTVKLKGQSPNTQAVGAKVTLYAENNNFSQELIPTRGFQSNVDSRLHFGLGKIATVDSLEVEWPDGKKSLVEKPEVNQQMEIDYEKVQKKESSKGSNEFNTWFTDHSDYHQIPFIHQENEFVDFERDRLLFHMISSEGPPVCVADVNNDKLDDLFIGGAKDSPGALLVQDANGQFYHTNENIFTNDKTSEDTDCHFFDIDNDGDQDLYVTSGGSEFPSSSTALIDRLYLNDGKGKFHRTEAILPGSKFESSSCVESFDFDQDGDLDLFVGLRLRPFLYGVPVRGYLLENDGNGAFTDVTEQKAPGLIELGLITDMKWVDIDTDGDEDMVIVGEYMPVTIFINDGKQFNNKTEELGLSETKGWWNVIETADLNQDGFPDLIGGNHGWNSRFKASVDQPVKMYVNDFDRNGTVEQIITRFNDEKSYPMVLKTDIIEQLPYLKDRYRKFTDYKEQQIHDIFTEDQLKNAVVSQVNNLSTSVFINNPKQGFDVVSLPVEAQFSPVYAVLVDDFNRDGFKDILLGGNLYRSKPEVGIYDASYGLILKGNGQGHFKSLSYNRSGFFVKGAMRDAETINIDNNRFVIVTVNNNKVKLFRYEMDE